VGWLAGRVIANHQHAGPSDNGYPTSTATMMIVAQSPTFAFLHSSFMAGLYRNRPPSTHFYKASQ